MFMNLKLPKKPEKHVMKKVENQDVLASQFLNQETKLLSQNIMVREQHQKTLVVAQLVFSNFLEKTHKDLFNKLYKINQLLFLML